MRLEPRVFAHRPNSFEHMRVVAVAPALSSQPAAVLRRPKQAPEQPFVIRDPVEHRVGEHDVDWLRHREVGEARPHRVHVRDTALLDLTLQRVDHFRRSVERVDLPVRQALEQIERHGSGAATRIEHRLVATQPQIFDDLLRPAPHRLADPGVDVGVPKRIRHRYAFQSRSPHSSLYTHGAERRPPPEVPA